MKPRSLLPLALVVLVWNQLPLSCNAVYIKVWDTYIDGPGTANHADGYRLLNPLNTTTTVASGKPVLDCAIGWKVTAVDALQNELSPECQPTGITADGKSWENM